MRISHSIHQIILILSFALGFVIFGENIEKTENREFYEYTQYYEKPRPENLTFNYLYKKNSPEDMDNFVFIRNAVNIRTKPTTKSKIIKQAKYAQKYKVIGKVKEVNAEATGKSGREWYEIIVKGSEKGYILASGKLAIKREFDWHDMMRKIEKLNDFVVEELARNREIYVLDDYVPLGGGEGEAKDRFGNRENQSERAYLDRNFKGEYINVPDRSLMTIVAETDKYIKVKIDVYDGSYYMKKNARKHLKKSGIRGEIMRFIYMDRKSQNEIVVEKNAEDGKWNVVTTSFITTGKDAGTSYATPFGAFLIAYGKPVMAYTGQDITVIIGDAKNAVRFSGGGYMHGIPSVFEPKETREARKAMTAKRIGTYPESHKCVRHYDDQMKFIYNWLGNASPGHKHGHRKPIMPTVVLTK